MTPLEVAKEKILKLEEMLKSKHPGLPHQLREVHGFLREQPECVTLFKTEPEMSAVLVEALSRHTNVELVVKTSAKKATSAASLKKSSASDLGF